MSDTKLMDALALGRAIIDDGTGVDYEHYMHLAEEVQNGLYIEIKDPFERAVAAMFQLVLEEDMDPWSIDLREFARKYMEKVREDEDVDLITAGKLIRMAWEVLKRKSDLVVEKLTAYNTQENEEQEADLEAAWDAFDPFPVMEEPVDAGAALVVEEPPLREPVRRVEPSPVSILDLLKAVEKVRADYERRKVIRERRKKAREQFAIRVEEKIHREDLEDEIAEVWERLTSMPTCSVLFSELHHNTREDVVKCFTSLLFLYKRGRVELHQDYPFGEIEIEVRAEEKGHVEHVKEVDVEA